MIVNESEEVLLPAALRDLVKVKEVREERKEGCITLTVELSPEFIDHYGHVHGALLSMLAVASAEVVAKEVLSSEEYLVAVTHNINFIRQPGALGDLEVRSCVHARSDSIIHVTSFISCDDTEVANALTVFVIVKGV